MRASLHLQPHLTRLRLDPLRILERIIRKRHLDLHIHVRHMTAQDMQFIPIA